MNAITSSYTVGRGKPPLHTRFRKGQSGNPSGKPGPAKLARQRFQRALCEALDGTMEDFEQARPRGYLEKLVRRITLDALNGNLQALKLILSELDDEVAHSNVVDAGDAQQESDHAGAAGNAEDGTAEPPLEDYALWLKANRGE